jgi:hypothetical protein
MIAINTGITTKTDGMIARSAMSIATDRGRDHCKHHEISNNPRLIIEIKVPYPANDAVRRTNRTTFQILYAA